VLPDKLFESYRTLGEATGAILAALEQNGYVERSFFRTEPGGVALVTRLERINDDGSPSAENERWAAAAQPLESTRSLLDLLHGLFFVDPGHYRVIVFVLQDLPFSQSAETITAQQAHAWLTSGANVLSPEIAALPFTGGHVTVLIYEFASDGSKVQVVTSQLTGKQHLEKAGLLTVLDKVQ
jgi:succinylarginine dihydrolase